MCLRRASQLTIEATDDARPPQIASTKVVITVIRNPNGPRFRADFYNVTVGEYADVQDGVVLVTATDADSPTVSLSPPFSVVLCALEICQTLWVVSIR